ncbi:putative disease resistance protein RGA4 [Chenopodium quinoa]|uniref:Uncharacterized protein n=1 Tax=Chenopodium quinoa TaxID=63459 RepID=A0A803MLA4_CHEQI|nr:putative disease resistance protein RGA4 [Chenopodium quinoa]
MKLPTSITRLVNLQSLYLEKLPRDMSKLVNLRHLKLAESKKLRHMPMGLGKLTDLRTLDTFIVGNQFDSEAGIMGRLADLNQLNNLSGNLDIEVRRESKYIALSEISATNLNMKENLRELNIRFENGTKEDKRVLECLKPPYNLKILKIDGYGGERLPSWMMDSLHNHLPCLTMIKIKRCKSCKYLCSFGRLPHLEYLFLSGLDEVEYVADNENELSQAPLFPSLIHLRVSVMPKLKGWWEMTSSEQDSKEDIQLHVQVQHQHLVNWKPAFPKLRTLDVDSAELAITITRQQIGGFTSLKELSISPSSIGEQSHQQQACTLPFSSCFPNLRLLEFWFLKIKVLPEGIRDLSTLQTLKIYGLENIKEIPEWIDSLTSLQKLDFKRCQRLESLPHQIVNLPNLNTLSISLCDKLREKCQSPNGEYWHLIQHIPCLNIY